ncbi:hypothetical protein [Actinoplanes sp. L3-i22]|uniref:hypothetical protein n=1 Tax=Actinoplanes sp. L3-i22 TaxID=2836373 RepID=UPI001C774B1C|nr:hypothetical protein [Actinoplanes sp. L3-i22]BCY09049.1 hypothetical protein L3i22_041370 [Actinoplanes sp. L3-i22]
MENNSLDDELERLTRNPRAARGLKDGLERLARGENGPVFSEMAKDLLSGRIDLRSVAQSSAYGREFGAAYADFERWQENLSDEERQKTLRDVKSILDGDPPQK